ncbi:MAG: phenylalanine--tRNA ligase subunit alpha [Candidatus Diapherotrites archaeon CG08_land_8_20_14_0_20_30_16]|nr:MAG: phenylalanine--tRNA ligase subunit alpha [Candidatus Diapherotrites archaeon CG08_land_8_20_14_0_20_30_16]
MEFTSDEILCLSSLGSKFVSFQELSDSLGINIDSVRRAINILQEKGLVDIEKKEASTYKLSKFGKLYTKEQFPEELILKVLSSDKLLLDTFRKQLRDKSAFIFGYAMKNKLIECHGDFVKKTDALKDFGFASLHNALQDLDSGKEISDKTVIGKLLKMNLLEAHFKSDYFVKRNTLGEKYSKLEVQKTQTYLTQDMLKTQSYKKVNFKPYNVVSEVDPLFLGKYQPYLRFLDLVKQKLVGMGFEEMPTDLITTEFYNFDVPFQPQNHPARTWSDTYSLKRPSLGDLPNKDLVNKVKAAHESGGNTGSKGWKYNWQESIAQKLMPVAHGTAFSARLLSQGVDSPKRYFAFSRVYRPDVIDATHLSEFNQLEGFVLGKDISFKHLLGLLSQFAKEFAGAEEIMFTPCYYPFTEPSASLHAKHPKLGWVELGGSGIFRPEFTETLGIKERVIAWGIGIDRLAMFNLDITDIRDLFSTKLDWLRNKPIVEKI